MTFIDEATGDVFATTKMRARELPEDLSIPTTMHLGGDDWQVVRAQPSSRALYSKLRALELRMSRVLEIEAGAILYSLPTICDAIPGLSRETVDGSECVLCEDDWRQIELVSASCCRAVDQEIVEIRQVQKLGEPGGGWPEIRVRSKPRAPLVGNLALQELVDRIGCGGDSRPLAYSGSPSRIEHGFALLSPGCCIYGVAPAGRVQVLGMHPGPEGEATPESVAPLVALAVDHNLELVDWCHGRRFGSQDPIFARQLVENCAK
ncbi:MAG: hypothetical protein GY930_05870 [bacterium]|nr:hypothetical protein [bacterium]